MRRLYFADRQKTMHTRKVFYYVRNTQPDMYFNY